MAVTLSKRQDDNASRRSGRPTWTRRRASSIERRSSSTPARCGPVFVNGPPAEKVDLLVIGEGYTAAEMPKFHARRAAGCCRRSSPRSRSRAGDGDFNVRALDLPSAESGINRPNAGVFRRTPLSAEYNIFDSERYVLTLDNRALRDAASAAPYEFIEILVNDETYGGGGIFNDQATASVDSAFSPYVFVHEFGHHFAALADEYYTSDVAYETGAAEKPEPWEPNVTALHDPAHAEMEGSRHAPARRCRRRGTRRSSRSTPPAIQQRRREIRARNAPEAEMDALFREQQAWDRSFWRR